MTSPEAAGVPPVIDYDHFLDTFGLGPQEVDATVAFGRYVGTVAEMLSDPKCPVGGIVANAYATGGIEAVDTKLQGLSVVDEGFSLPISESTRSHHEGTTSRDDLLAAVPAEAPDFLVPASPSEQSDPQSAPPLPNLLRVLNS